MSVTADFYQPGFTNQENTHHLPEGFTLALERLSFALRTRNSVQTTFPANKGMTTDLSGDSRSVKIGQNPTNKGSIMTASASETMLSIRSLNPF